MKAAVVRELNRLVIDEVPEPEITAAGQVKVRTRVAGICSSTDPAIIRGDHPAQRPFPSILGHEAAGDVVEVAADVTDPKVGDRVGVKGWENACMAETIVTTTDNVLTIPDELGYGEAVVVEPLHCVYSMAVAAIAPGDVVAVFGQGASGLLFDQVARVFGARSVIGIDRNRYKLDLARKLGADAVIDTRETGTSGAVDALLDLHNGGIDCIIDTIGAEEVFATFPDALAFQGKIGIYAPIRRPILFDFWRVVAKGGTFLSTESREGYTRNAYVRSMALVASGEVNVRPLITQVVPFDEIDRAFEILNTRSDQRIKVLLSF